MARTAAAGRSVRGVGGDLDAHDVGGDARVEDDVGVVGSVAGDEGVVGVKGMGGVWGVEGDVGRVAGVVGVGCSGCVVGGAVGVDVAGGADVGGDASAMNAPRGPPWLTGDDGS